MVDLACHNTKSIKIGNIKKGIIKNEATIRSYYSLKIKIEYYINGQFVRELENNNTTETIEIILFSETKENLKF